MKLASLALACGLAACSGAPSTADNAAQAEPSSGLGPRLPKSAAPAAEPVLTAAQPAAAAPGEVPAEPVAKPGPAAAGSCWFATLERFEGRTLKWEGECADGKANGKGVLRAYPKAGSPDKAVLIFFGTLERGEPKLGVIDTPDGFMAGEFVKGKLQDSGDPNVTSRAFKIATEAATFVSERLKAAGNAASATFYAKKAQSLQQQLD
jgi:hypothetical protein